MGQALKIFQSEQTSDLSSLTLTLEQVEEQGFDKIHVFEVAVGENVLGYIPQDQLKQFLEQNPDQYQNTFVRKIGQEVWMPSTQQVYLQRRKPTLVRENEISENEKFFYLKESQKIGPFSIEELKLKLEKKEILMTEMIIPEKGGNWFKLFELGSLDRRLSKRSHLPERPAAYIFEQVSKIKGMKRSEEKDAIAGLAYIGHIKSGKVTDQQDQAPTEEYSDYQEDTAVRTIKRHMLYKRLIGVALGIVFIATLGWYFIFKWNIEPFRETKSTDTTKDAPTLTPISIISGSNGPRQLNKTRRIPASTPKVTPTTIKDSNIYKNQRDQFLNYDQGQDPIENDPVREQLSSETINPQPIEEPENQNWATPENLQPVHSTETPFDGEVNN